MCSLVVIEVAKMALDGFTVSQVSQLNKPQAQSRHRFVCGSVDSYAVLVDDFFDYRQ